MGSAGASGGLAWRRGVGERGEGLSEDGVVVTAMASSPWDGS